MRTIVLCTARAHCHRPLPVREIIHPFPDRNGRAGRLMISLYLASEGLLHKPALYLSDYFERDKTAYIDHLMAVRQGGHLRQWLVFLLFWRGRMGRASFSVFRAAPALKQRIERDVLPRFSTRRQDNVQALLRHLYAGPVTDVKSAAEITGASTNKAAALIQDMIAFAILTEVTGQRRDRLFVFRDYLSIFMQPT